MRTPQILILTICLVVAAVACGSTEEETSTTAPPTTTTTTAPTTAPTTTAPPTTTSASDFSSEEALAIADAYFAANSSGDFEALHEFFVADPELADAFIAHDEQLFAWNVAQGTTLSPPECTTADGAVEETMTVTCQTFNHDVLVQAVDGPPVPIRLTLKITPDGIVEEDGSFGQPDFNTVGEPFDDWMKANHPDKVDAIGFGRWTTIEEAKQNGTLTAQYAAEWAAYLEANGCAYNDGC